MLWHTFLLCCLVMLSATLAAESSQNKAQAQGQPEPVPGQKTTQVGQPNQATTTPDSFNHQKDPSSAASADTSSASASQKRNPGESVFGAGCRWDPTTSNIKQVSFDFRTGQAPPSTWFSDVHDAATETAANKLNRRDTSPPSQHGKQNEQSPRGGRPVLDASYHTRLIDVLTFRARYGSFGSSLNSAGCALPAFSERLAQLEAKEGEIVNNYTRQHKPTAGTDNIPNAMFFWAGISNYDPTVRSDLIQTVVFYGDGCAANPRQGLCIYAAEYSNFRYNPEDHMCMGSNMPVFYPVDTTMTVVYRTQNGFRTQESWIDGKMVSYLRSAGDQVMNSFVITQECKGCTWPLSEQVYNNIVIKFSEPELHFDALGLCTGGAILKSQPRTEDGGKTWIIEEVRVPSGEHPTGSTSTDASASAGGRNKGEQNGTGDAGDAVAYTGKTDADAATSASGGSGGIGGGGDKDGRSDKSDKLDSGLAPGPANGGGTNGGQGVADGQSGKGDQGKKGAGSPPSTNNGVAPALPKTPDTSGAARSNGDKGTAGAPGPNGPNDTSQHSSGGRAAHDAHMAHQPPPANGGATAHDGHPGSNSGTDVHSTSSAADSAEKIPNVSGAGSNGVPNVLAPNPVGKDGGNNVYLPLVVSAGANNPAPDSKPKDNTSNGAAKPDPSSNHPQW
ncbi:hypothetical protein NDA16_001562 [Ustilago loliicola]|nr:hypothetical protein NDA16_001562 [Ustilago loliicola]